jgi:mRNA interferase RelE/StbE
MRTIVWSHEATRQFLALPVLVQDRIEAKIAELATNPGALANQVRALKGVKALRLRVGDYRVIFSEAGVILTILRIGHRSDIYS